MTVLASPQAAGPLGKPVATTTQALAIARLREPSAIGNIHAQSCRTEVWLLDAPITSSMQQQQAASREIVPMCTFVLSRGRALTKRAFNRARLSSEDGRGSKTGQAASSLQPAGSRLDHGHRRHLAPLMLDGRHFPIPVPS